MSVQVYKTKVFAKWARREGLDDCALLSAVDEIEKGRIDAMLGGNVYKKRIAIGGKGKSGGTRTILVFKSGSKAFFMTGFAKSEKANIKEGELKALKLMSKLLFAKSHEQLSMDIQAGILIEVER